MAFSAIVGLTAISCSHGDDEQLIAGKDIPANAKAFIATYFPQAQVKVAMMDKEEYEVALSDGTIVEFTKLGDWTNVDAPNGSVIPTGFYPDTINVYVKNNYPAQGINEISKEPAGFDVELTNRLDLYFFSDGRFAGMERKSVR